MRTWPIYVAAAVLGAAGVFFSGCGQSPALTAPEETPLELPGIVVDAAWLRAHLDDPRLVVLDAREPKAYDAGHIPGAIHLAPGALNDPAKGELEDLAPVPVIEKALSQAGIDATRTVVVYDGANFREAARVFWVLEVHGHPRVAVLNGGFGVWQNGKLPVTAETPPATPRRFVANMQPQRLATKLSVARSIGVPGTAIVDSRSGDEYRGLVSKAKRKGHIPSAHNVDFLRTLVVNKQGACSLKYSEDLLDLFRAELADRGKVITYCNSGNRASVNYLALRVLGYDVAVYDGSWLEWGNDSDLPIE